MAEQQKKYVDPNKFSNYGPAMAPVAQDPMAVEWQKTDEAKLAEATTPQALAVHVKDAAAAAALLAKVQGAYKTNALTLTVIGAVSQHVMLPANGGRDIWNAALLATFRKTKDEYIQTFILDQLRWCGSEGRLPEIRTLKASAVSANVRKYIDWVVSEVSGAMLPK